MYLPNLLEDRLIGAQRWFQYWRQLVEGRTPIVLALVQPRWF